MSDGPDEPHSPDQNLLELRRFLPRSLPRPQDEPFNEADRGIQPTLRSLWEPRQGPPRRLADPDWMRGAIALTLVGLLALIVIASLAIVALTPAAVDNLARVLGLLLGPLIGLAGAAIGFYYGGQRRS